MRWMSATTDVMIFAWFARAQLNIANPQTGAQKKIEITDENKLRCFYDKRISAEVEGDELGDVRGRCAFFRALCARARGTTNRARWRAEAAERAALKRREEAARREGAEEARREAEKKDPVAREAAARREQEECLLGAVLPMALVACGERRLHAAEPLLARMLECAHSRVRAAAAVGRAEVPTQNAARGARSGRSEAADRCLSASPNGRRPDGGRVVVGRCSGPKWAACAASPNGRRKLGENVLRKLARVTAVLHRLPMS